MKYKFPEFYRDCLPSERGYIYDMDFFAMLPTCDKLGRKVCILYPGMCTWFNVTVYLFSVIFVNINVVPEATRFLDNFKKWLYLGVTNKSKN